MKLLVEKDDIFKITVYAYMDKNDDVIATIDEKEIPIDSKVTTVNFTFRRPNNKDSVSLSSSSISTDAEGKVKVDIITMQDKVRRNLLVDWDLTDEEGQKIPFNVNNLDKLHPAVSRVVSIEALSKIKI